LEIADGRKDWGESGHFRQLRTPHELSIQSIGLDGENLAGRLEPQFLFELRQIEETLLYDSRCRSQRFQMSLLAHGSNGVVCHCFAPGIPPLYRDRPGEFQWVNLAPERMKPTSSPMVVASGSRYDIEKAR
jgi:hypothetical protein